MTIDYSEKAKLFVGATFSLIHQKRVTPLVTARIQEKVAKNAIKPTRN